MPVTISDEDWEAIYSYFAASFSAVDNSSVHEVMDLQEQAWERVQRIAHNNGRMPADPVKTARAFRDQPRPSASLDEQTLREEGFSGFVPISTVGSNAVPEEPGVYVVLRPGVGDPQFLDSNPGGRFKGRDPTLPTEALKMRWVADAPVVYVGKANLLRRRLRELRDFGAGKPIGHWGGRLIWQLTDSGELVVAWKTTPSEDPLTLESLLLERFRARHGSLPFANMRA